MGQRHKHADMIIAWANGAQVEFRSHLDGGWEVTSAPSWFEDYEYRIKPPAKKYRVAVFSTPCIHTCTADTQEDVKFFEASPHFVRWLTDWVEYSD